MQVNWQRWLRYTGWHLLPERIRHPQFTSPLPEQPPVEHVFDPEGSATSTSFLETEEVTSATPKPQGFQGFYAWQMILGIVVVSGLVWWFTVSFNRWYMWLIAAVLTLFGIWFILLIARGTASEAYEELEDKLFRVVGYVPDEEEPERLRPVMAPVPLPMEKVSQRVRKHLVSGEVVYLEQRLHAFAVLRYWLYLALATVVMLTVTVISPTTAAVLIIAWLGVASICGYKVLYWHLDRFGVTNQRIIRVWGIPGISGGKFGLMPIGRLTDCKLIIPTASENLTALRVTKGKYGTLDIESAGQDQALKYVPYVKFVELAHKLIMSLLFPDPELAKAKTDGT